MQIIDSNQNYIPTPGQTPENKGFGFIGKLVMKLSNGKINAEKDLNKVLIIILIVIILLPVAYFIFNEFKQPDLNRYDIRNKETLLN